MQAQASATADHDIVKRYEEFSTKHAHLYEDACGQVDRGGSWLTPADREFLRVFESHLDELAEAAKVTATS